MLELDDIIDSPASLEIKRALAAKMIMCDLKPREISLLLNVSEGFVSKWKVIYEDNYLDKTIFNFKKLEWYLKIQQPV